MTRLTYVVEAYNTATESTNKIHDDDVAADVRVPRRPRPGCRRLRLPDPRPERAVGAGVARSRVDHGPLRQARLRRTRRDGVGERSRRAPRPAVVDEGGVVCATAQASRRPLETDRPVPAAAPLPAERPAGVARLAARRAPCSGRSPMSSTPRWRRRTSPTSGSRLPLYGAVAHPGWLLRFANAILVRNVVLGPWIHVSSDVSLLGIVQDGERVTARAVVVDEFERKGHRFVDARRGPRQRRPPRPADHPHRHPHPAPGRLSASGRPPSPSRLTPRPPAPPGGS